MRDVVRSRLGLAVGAAAAATWFVHLSLSYAFVPPACRSRTSLPLLLVSAVGVAVGVATVVAAVRTQPDGSGHQDPGWRRRARSRFQLDRSPQGPAARMASSGVAIAAYFTFVMLLAALVPILVDPCA